MKRNLAGWNRTILVALLGLFLFAGRYTYAADSGEAYITGTDDADSVYFVSDAAISLPDGCTGALKGLVTFNPDSSVTYNENAPVLTLHSAQVSANFQLQDETLREERCPTTEYHFLQINLESIVGMPDELPTEGSVWA